MQAGGFDLGALMQSAQAMQTEMARAQASLGELRATGSSGGGLVHAEVDGHGQLVGLTIDPSVVDADDVETLADLVVAAVRDAARAAEALASETMGTAASGLLGGGLMGGLPGLPDLSGISGLTGLPGLSGAPDDFGDFDDPDDPDDSDEVGEVGEVDEVGDPDDSDGEG